MVGIYNWNYGKIMESVRPSDGEFNSHAQVQVLVDVLKESLKKGPVCRF